VEAVRASIQQSPKRSARKHAMALGISSRSLRAILHADLKLHPYKMMLATKKNSCSGNLLKNFRTSGSAVGMISLIPFLSQHHFVRMQF